LILDDNYENEEEKENDDNDDDNDDGNEEVFQIYTIVRHHIFNAKHGGTNPSLRRFCHSCAL
jgi:hypothetical protein